MTDPHVGIRRISIVNFITAWVIGAEPGCLPVVLGWGHCEFGLPMLGL